MTQKISRLLLLGMFGCALTENFVPTEHATGISQEGYAAADYDLIVSGQRMGEASVWTEGAKNYDLKGDDSTALYVGFTIENTSDQPIQIQPEDVNIVVGKKRVEPISAEVFLGNTTVAPKSSGQVVFRFLTRPGIDPQELDAFTISWRAKSGELVYEQRTPFTEFEAPAYAYYHPYLFDYAYYRPFLYPFYYP